MAGTRQTMVVATPALANTRAGLIDYCIDLIWRRSYRAGESRTNLAGENLSKLIELTVHLRGPEGCPWDRAQDYDTLKGLLLEEAYEVVDAATARDFNGLEDELGDLLFLVVFYSRMAEEEGRFSIDDVVEHVHAKLIRRHPHVFGEAQAANAGEALQSWMAVKEQERAAAGKRARNSVLDGILPSLPSTLVAQELGTRAAEVGFEWAKVGDLLEKIEEEIHELRQELAAQPSSPPAGRSIDSLGSPATPSAGAGPAARVEEEVGDLLFAVANLSRFLHFDPESCLRRANQKFQRRFQAMEQEILKRGNALKECSLEEMEAVWGEIKAREGG
jgi:ATP diphosphatase